jgi:hypothetical protein
MGGGAGRQGFPADALPRGGQRRAGCAAAAPGGFDVAEAAWLEFDWWQARREAAGPQEYGVTIARVAAITYGKKAGDPSLLTSGIGRAEAMARLVRY